MTLDFAETMVAIENDAVAFVARRDIVTVSGSDAQSFLQGQLSQDLKNMEHGSSVESLLLSPQGKLDAYLQVIREQDERYLLLSAKGFGELILERLRRFKLRVKVEFSFDEREVILVRGPRSARLREQLPPEISVSRYDWPGLVGFDAIATLGELTIDVGLGDSEALEVARIRAGEPVMGADLDERTIAQETPLTERAVNFTKGCFTGQELVARLDARGSRVARHLRGLVVSQGERHRVPYVGEAVNVAGEAVGTITSTAFSSSDGCSYALGYIRRRVEPPCEAVVIAAGGEDELATRIYALPMID